MSYITEKFDAGEVKFEDGAAGWKMEDGEFRPLMNDALEELFDAGLIDKACVLKTTEARFAHTVRIMQDYTSNYTGPSDEERAEARAAMGEGVEMVNVITGHKWRT